MKAKNGFNGENDHTTVLYKAIGRGFGEELALTKDLYPQYKVRCEINFREHETNSPTTLNSFIGCVDPHMSI